MSKALFSEYVRRPSHEEFEDCTGRKTKIGFDEHLPGEVVLISRWSVSGVGRLSRFWADLGDTSEPAKAHELNCRRKFFIEHNSHSRRKPE